MDKIDLIKKFQFGDVDSFEQLYKIYSKKAFGSAYLISGDKDIAEDIVQETFFQCFKEIKKLKEPLAFDVWFYKTLVRYAWKISAKHKKTIPLEDIDYESLSSEMDYRETKLMLDQAIEKLSPSLKTVIILYYFNDMSIKEISKILGCFQGTVKSRLYNAKKALKKVLVESEIEAFYKEINGIKECKVND
ncbi:RNA polymerase sigma factor [Clostridium sp. 'White wine YQ']|uniref:RNA polymerase sigma factor n=1 Tax=Clostridium sp. 'White wine YQ' TaxID=3027474 RepID=UPI00236721E2|nr:sigma-70 family RNA polymerase sigma factor [Clostridium sp. 'White wine YQ']MDD7793485.1 sigma-70 family RNA polymerase sigma factor [Clostridium sp. 'White wine YQ']